MHQHFFCECHMLYCISKLWLKVEIKFGLKDFHSVNYLFILLKSINFYSWIFFLAIWRLQFFGIIIWRFEKSYCLSQNFHTSKALLHCPLYSFHLSSYCHASAYSSEKCLFLLASNCCMCGWGGSFQSSQPNPISMVLKVEIISSRPCRSQCLTCSQA